MIKNETMTRTVHGLQSKLLFLHLKKNNYNHCYYNTRRKKAQRKHWPVRDQEVKDNGDLIVLRPALARTTNLKCEHVVFVIRSMSGCFPKLHVEHVRRNDLTRANIARYVRDFAVY